MRIVSLGLVVAWASGMMYDVIDTRAVPVCAHGCARWSDLAADHNTANQSEINAIWSDGKPPSTAGTNCASPARACRVAWPPYPHAAPGTFAAYCYCAGTADAPTSAWGSCNAAASTPEQMNVVPGEVGTVVLSFVTFHEPWDQTHAAAIPPPRAVYSIIGIDGIVANRTATGMTHRYQSPVVDPGNPGGKFWNETSRK
jgi:hypothetical protein